MVGGHNSGLRRVCVRIPAGVCVGVCEGRAKNERLLGNKQGQRCNVQAQRRDVPERGAANVATLGSNIATVQRGSKSNARRSREAIIQRRDVGIQRRDVA